MIRKSKIPVVIFTLLIFISCVPNIADFDPVIYEKTVELKVESLVLINCATKPYNNYEKDIDRIMLEVEKAYEYSNGKPNNEITTEMWKILKDPEGNLLGGFFLHWENKQTLSQTMVGNSKKLIADAFDTIIGLESGKIKPNEK